MTGTTLLKRQAVVVFCFAPLITNDWVFAVVSQTTGALNADEIVLQSIATTRRKLQMIKAELAKLAATDDEVWRAPLQGTTLYVVDTPR